MYTKKDGLCLGNTLALIRPCGHGDPLQHNEIYNNIPSDNMLTREIYIVHSYVQCTQFLPILYISSQALDVQ